MTSRRKRERPEPAAIATDVPSSALPAFSAKRPNAQTTPSSKQPNNSPGLPFDKNEAKTGDKLEANASPAKSSRRKSQPPSKQTNDKCMKQQVKGENAQNSSAVGESMEQLMLPLEREGPSHGDTSQSIEHSQKLPLHKQVNDISAVSGEEINPSRPPERRIDRITRLLSHRRTLLSRIRLCKNALQSRLDHPTEVSKALSVAKAIQASGANGNAVDTTTADEVAAFREMTRLANQAAKKQRAELLDAQQSNEKRTSVSLRRGASVGKRMNAALSSLAPGGGSSSHLPEEGDVLLQEPSQPISSGGNVNTSAQILLSVNQSNQLSTQEIVNTSQYNLALPMAAPISAVIQAHELNQRKRINNALKGNRAAIPARNNSASGILPYTSLQLEHVVPRPAIGCPEAIALRGQRSHIREKLSLIYLERAKEVKNTENRSTPPDEIMSQHQSYSPIKNERATFPNTTSLLNGPSQPTKVPQRRKTQWDYVLEEMRWLASDFVEERKWKRSSSRIISAAVSAKASRILQITELEGQMIQAESSSPEMDIDGDGNKDDSTLIKEEISPCSRKLAGPSVRSPSIQRAYAKPTPADLEVSRGVARTLCVILSRAWDVLSDSGSAPEFSGLSDLNQTSSCDHQVKDQTDCVKQNDTKDATYAILRGGDANDPTFAVNERKHEHEVIEVLNQKISLSINSIANKLERRSKQRIRRPKKPARHLSNLSPNQLKVVEFTEFVWGLGENTGALVKCAEMSETEFVLALLNSPEHEGPCLILCPTVRELEWRNKLSRIEGRRVLMFGQSGKAGHQQKLSWPTTNVGDIVIAKLSLLAKVDSDLDLKSFAIIIADTRATQRPSSNENSESTVHQHFSVNWWSSFFEKLESATPKRMLLTSPISNVANSEAAQFSKTQRLRFNILCAHVAFVVGPTYFRSTQKDVLRRVLSWAKHESKAQFVGKKVMPSTVETKVTNLVDLFSVLIEKDEKRDIPFKVEIRLCQMSNEQNMMYENYCRLVRGALSFKRAGTSEGGMDQNAAAANAIEQLRLVCFHSELPSFRNSDRDCSSSQTSIDCAEQILNGSAKLRALVTFLKYDCGIQIHGWNILRKYLLDDVSPDGLEADAEDESKPTAENVAIMCSSPEGQLLTSRLLNSLGIEHDTLATIHTCSSLGSTDVQESNRNTLAWIRGQRAISNYTRLGCSSHRKFRLLVLSPLSAGTMPFAYGVGCSDVIVSLDEDWSGRSCATIREIAENCVVHRKRSREKRINPRLIRLICKNTLEEAIVCGVSDGDELAQDEFLIGNVHEELDTWLRDSLGCFVLHPNKTKETTWKQLKTEAQFGFQFPAKSLLRICHSPLIAALSTKGAQAPCFLSANSSTFLPFQEISHSRKSALTKSSQVWDFIRELLATEERMSPTIFQAEVQRNHDRRHVAASIVPPNEITCPVECISVQDKRFMIVQFYMFDSSERFTNDQAITNSFPSDSLRSSPTTSPDISGMTMLQNHDAELGHYCQPGGLTPDVMATSMLMYIQSDPRVDDLANLNDSALERSNGEKTCVPYERLNRQNVYATSYANTKIEEISTFARSANAETLVYFPPLFPGIILSSKRARLDLDVLLTMRNAKKRKSFLDDASLLQKAKRPKSSFAVLIDDQSTEATAESRQGTPHVQPIQEGRSIKQETTSATVTNDSIVHNADVPTLSFVSEDETNFDDPSSFLLEIDEDYGLLGVGATASVAFSGQEAGNNTVDPPHYMHWSDNHDFQIDFLDQPSALGPEDLDALYHKGRVSQSLASMLLLVPRKNAPTTGGVSGLIGGQAIQGSQFPSSIAQEVASIGPVTYHYPVTSLQNGISVDAKANGGTHVKKLKHPNLAVTGASSAFSQPPASDGVARIQTLSTLAGTSGMSSKDALRIKALGIVGSRQYGYSLFDAPGFRLASVRIRDRVHYRMVASLMGRPDFLVNKGAGLDSQRSTPRWRFSPKTNEWTGVGPRTKIQTNTVANAQSVQRQTQLTTTVVPASVDFGPFQTGYCDNPAQTVVDGLSLSTKNGVILPMGVKTSSYKLDQHIRLWATQEDHLLESLVVQYPDNWYLVARGFLMSESSAGKGIATRSPRQCKERWEQLLNEGKVGNRTEKDGMKLLGGNKIRKASEADAKPISLSALAGTRRKSMMLSSALNKNRQEFDVSVEDKASTETVNRPFVAFRAASAKKICSPITILGVVAGQKPQLALSHASHQQSLQATLTTTSSGQSEMWPLQILDVVEKQRIASRNPQVLPTYPVPSTTPTTTNRPISSGQTSRPAYPTPPRSARPPGSAPGAPSPSSGSHQAPHTTK